MFYLRLFLNQIRGVEHWHTYQPEFKLITIGFLTTCDSLRCRNESGASKKELSGAGNSVISVPSVIDILTRIIYPGKLKNMSMNYFTFNKPEFSTGEQTSTFEKLE